MALVKSMVTLGRALQPASFSLTLHSSLSSFLYNMPFPVPSQIKIKPAFLLQLRRLGGGCSSIDGPVVVTPFPVALLEASQSTFPIPDKW